MKRQWSLRTLTLLCGCMAWGGCLSSGAAEVRYEPRWESLDRRPTPEWFLDAKFGIFIHWGVYSVPGWGVKGQYAEWYWHNMANKKDDNPWWQYHRRVWGADFDYANFAALFRCEHFNADEWADLFAALRARSYVVPTSKHHDGFCLWPSAEAHSHLGPARGTPSRHGPAAGTCCGS
ncbi:MAG: hypothetical protein KatS3mg132_441 [Limisphaera sp.]|nr:MAG: hypothetical protein KatS3mg132_441 [Limisphaera sp.]